MQVSKMPRPSVPGLFWSWAIAGPSSLPVMRIAPTSSSSTTLTMSWGWAVQSAALWRPVTLTTSLSATGICPVSRARSINSCGWRAESSPCSRALRGEAGHPVLLPKSLARELAAAPAQGSVRRWLLQRPHRTIPVESPAILFDIDTPERYQALIHGELELRSADEFTTEQG